MKHNYTCFHQDSTHSKVTKGRTVHAKWIAFILYRAQQTNVNIKLWNAWMCTYWSIFLLFTFQVYAISKYNLILQLTLRIYMSKTYAVVLYRKYLQTQEDVEFLFFLIIISNVVNYNANPRMDLCLHSKVGFSDSVYEGKTWVTKW